MAASQLRRGFGAHPAGVLNGLKLHMSENIDGVRRASALIALLTAMMHAPGSSLRTFVPHVGKRRASHRTFVPHCARHS
jgi:hypothetical protein